MQVLIVSLILLTKRILGSVKVEGPAAALFFQGISGGKKTIISEFVDMETTLVQTSVSKEYFQDMVSQMGQDGEEFLIRLLAQDLKEDIDSRTLTLLNTMATPGITVALDSLTDTSYKRKFEHIGLAIVSALNSISDVVKRGGTGFAVVSSKVASALAITGELIAPYNKSEYDRDYAGKLYGYIDIFIDTDKNISGDYALVGYKGNDSKLTGGVSYVIYNHTVQILNDYSLEENSVIIRERSVLAVNPLDSSDGTTANSDYYTKITVDFTNINI